MSNLLPIADGPELRGAGACARAPPPTAASAVTSGCTPRPPQRGSPDRRSWGGSSRRCATARRSGTSTSAVLVLLAFLFAQTVLTWFARRASFVLSEQMFAELREDFMQPRARAAALDGRARGNGRPRVAHDGRRRRVDTHGALRAAGDDDRHDHRAADGRRRNLGQPCSPRCRVSQACPRSTSAHVGT